MESRKCEEQIENILNCLTDEFQSIWIVDTKTLGMQAFCSDVSKSVPDSVKIVEEFNSYPTAREWYVKNCVMSQDSKSVLYHTDTDYIYPRMEKGESIHVEYSRLSGSKINYNQILIAALDKDESGKIKHFMLAFRDIDVRTKAERDDLTGVYTRQVFFSKAEKLLRDNPDEKYDITISDIVDFKKINETYGDKTGDDILRWIGSSLAPAIGDDLLVGRYGGDQFVVMAKREYMDFINHEEEFNFLAHSQERRNLPPTNVKLGIYQDISHNASIIASCDKARLALNSIKHQYGQQIAVYTEKLQKDFENARKIENSMYKALKEQQFKVYYQPKHDACTGKLVGAEALIRWVHPEYGFMSPADFIPLFEQNGFVVEIDNYVWNRTCQNIKAWQDKGIKTVPVSVNASKLTFKQSNLLKKMTDAVEDNGITPDCLHIEITETLMTDDIDSLINKLLDIRTKGYKIELDDFGAGYSSINILSSIPLDIVKLDMSFMKQFGDEKRAKVLAASIKLAKDLGYKTVSEGVEIKEQNDMLSDLGVDAIQGYYYSKPLPEADFEEYLINNQ